MKKQFVTYPITLALKELGFNDFHRFGWYIIEDGTEFGKSLHVSGDEAFYFDTEYCIKAPLWQQAIDLLREKYGIIIAVHAYHDLDAVDDVDQILWDFTLWDKEWNDVSDYTYYHSYEEAREAAILEAIKLVKENKK